MSLILFFLCEFREINPSLGGLFLCKSSPFILWGITLYFWHGNLNICSLYLHCEQVVIPLNVFQGEGGNG